MNDDFAEILLRLEPDAPDKPGTYRVEAFVDNLGLWTGGPLLAISPDLLSDAQTASEYGHKLWSILNAWPHLQEAFSTALGRTDQKVRLRVMLPAAATDLHRIDWEFLIFNAEQEPVGISPLRPVSRFLPLPSIGAPAAKRTLRILIAVANPANLPPTLAPIQVSDEVQSLFTAFQPAIREGRVVLNILPGRSGLSESLTADLQRLGCTILPGPSTLDRITESLRSQDVLHLIAHGNFLKNKPLLTLEDESGNAAVTPGADEPDASSLVARWSGNRVLIFLQSCRSDPKDRFPAAGLGPLFVKAGVPAVVAMSDFVAMTDARRFANSFYSTLLESGRVDLAANAGRREIYAANSSDWAIPVLYSRLRSDTPLWTPDPLRQSIRTLAAQLSRTREVIQPFPIEATVVRHAEAVEWELRDTTPSSRVDALITAKKELAEGAGKLIILLGSRGRAKTALLQKLFVDLADSCGHDGAAAPILINLQDSADTSDDISGMFQAFHNVLKEREIAIDASLARDQFEAFPFVLLADCGQDIGSSGFITALSRLQSVIRTTGRSAFLTMDESAFKPDLFEGIQPTVLVIRDLRADTLRSYLARYRFRNSSNQSQSLPESLQKQLTGPFRDLASIPWLLGRLLDLATRNSKLIQSRFRVLERFVGERLAKLSDIPGGATIARAAMQQMAWRLHTRGQTEIALFESYEILTDLRGRRDFPLDGFRYRILECALMAQGGPDGLRFSYAGAQAYFTACHINHLEPFVRMEVLRGITSGLARLDRLRLWQDVIVLLAGHMEQPSQLISMLLDLGFSQGDHLLLAARCFHEAHSAGRTVDTELFERLTDSLIAWSSPSNAIAPRRRSRAVDGFGYLLGYQGDHTGAAPNRGPHNDTVANCQKRLIRQALRLILETVRSGLDGKPSFDYSDVRFAALSLLFEHQPEVLKQFADPSYNVTAKKSVQKFIEDWGNLNVDAMCSLLNDPAATVEDTEKSLLAGLAAFALTTVGTQKTVSALSDRFHCEPVNRDLHWLITDALINLRAQDAICLVRQAIESKSLADELIDQVIYAIGKLGGFLPDSKEVDFLRQHLGSSKATRQGRALRALAEVHGPTASCEEVLKLRDACHKILESRKLAEAQKLLGGDPAARFTRHDRDILASYALQALISIGDAKSLPVLRRYYLHASDGEPVSWEQEQKRTTEEAAEQIRLRLGTVPDKTQSAHERITYALPDDSKLPGTLRATGL